jgi:hypothetical protein
MYQHNIIFILHLMFDSTLLCELCIMTLSRVNFSGPSRPLILHFICCIAVSVEFSMKQKFYRTDVMGHELVMLGCASVENLQSFIFVCL